MVAKPTKEEQAYWENVLREHGLSMEAGRRNRVSATDRRRRLICVGDSANLEEVNAAVTDAETGRRVRPTGHGPDN